MLNREYCTVFSCHGEQLEYEICPTQMSYVLLYSEINRWYITFLALVCVTTHLQPIIFTCTNAKAKQPAMQT